MICHFERTFRFIIDESKAKLSFRNNAVCLFEMTDDAPFEMKHDCLFDMRQGIFLPLFTIERTVIFLVI